jgi:hypothetical protein
MTPEEQEADLRARFKKLGGTDEQYDKWTAELKEMQKDPVKWSKYVAETEALHRKNMAELDALHRRHMWTKQIGWVIYQADLACWAFAIMLIPMRGDPVPLIAYAVTKVFSVYVDYKLGERRRRK